MNGDDSRRDGETPASPRAGEVTALLDRWRDGDESAFEKLLETLYEELRGLAGAYMARERSNHTLQPTALVHEAYLRLTRSDAQSMSNRVHFFAAAAQTMRRVLVESARRHRSAKRTPVIDPLARSVELPDDVELLDLERALQELDAIEPRHARLVELRYFGGLSNREASAVLDRSTSSLDRDWVVARSWLHRRLRSLSNRRSAETP